MPYLKHGSSSSSSSSINCGFQDESFERPEIVSDSEYAGTNFPGHSELPLSEQLEPIAVIGMGCRLPGDVKSTSDFWKLMVQKGTSQTPRVPSSRFNIDAYLHSDNNRPGSFSVPGGYFLNETLQEFDPSFFNITPVEAMWMDPQQRKLLEVVYEAFESAGVTLQDVAGTKTACFAATFTSDFQQIAFKERAFRHSLAATGVDPGLLSNRISHVFNLKGPSLVVNTACSSSVYAIHNACNALRTGECTAAVVAGSNLILTVDQHMNTAKLGVLSPSSTCHTFNEHADGYGRAEGVGAIYLKRLTDAIRDNNPIRGVIRSSATNNNGNVPGVGITAPSFDGQRAVISHAYARGGKLDPRMTGYFECHGTGTAMGDPIEVHAVSDSMNQKRGDEEDPLLIGAVKTNIGHSEAASGLSAVIKAILSVERGIIPPTYGVTNLSSAIQWKSWKVKVATDAVPFPANLPVRRISINSFGYGGTNAHIVVESSESLLSSRQKYKYTSVGPDESVIPQSVDKSRFFLLPFSAHDKPALLRNIASHAAIVEKYDPLDLAYTLAIHRTRFLSRGAVVASNGTLESAFGNGLQAFIFAEKKKIASVGFLFTGQGAQWSRMGAELMEYYPSFLKTIRELDMILQSLRDGPDWSLEISLLEYSESSRVHEAEFAQPLCTAIQVALVNLLQLWDIKPKVTCGHSSGEIAAAYAAGLISASEAIIVAYYRGKVVREINTNGAMLAVGLGADEITPYIDSNGDVTIACHNSPNGVTLSGDADALETVRVQLSTQSIFARFIKTNGKAYHSKHMKPAAAKYEELMLRAKEGRPSNNSPLETNAKMVSSVFNVVFLDGTELDETYWSANLLNPVLFNQAIQTIGQRSEFSDVDVLIEIGPHSALSGPFRQIKSGFNFNKLDYLPSLIRGEDSVASVLRLAGELFVRDYPFDLGRVTAVEQLEPSGKINLRKGNLIVDLPPYQWDTKRYFAESRESREHRTQKHPRHDILGSLVIGASMAEPTWRNVFRVRDLPWLKDHLLGGENVFPAAGYLSMAMEAITQLNELEANPVSIESYIIRDVTIRKALVTPDDDSGLEVVLNMRPSIQIHGPGHTVWWDFNVSSITKDGFQMDHGSGSISINSCLQRPTRRKLPNFPQSCSPKAWYQALKNVGFDYGPKFQDIERIYSDGINSMAACDCRIKVAVDSSNEESRYVLHPATIDSCLQLLIIACHSGQVSTLDAGAVPIQFGEITIWEPTVDQLAVSDAKAFSWLDHAGTRLFAGNSQLVANNGQVLMEISNACCNLYEAAIPQRLTEPLAPQPYSEMVWKLDVQSLSGSESLEPSTYIELAAFKSPGLKALAIGSSMGLSALEKTSDLYLTITENTPESVDSLKNSLGDFQNAKAELLDVGDLSGKSGELKEFDLLVTSFGASNDLGQLRSLLVTGGKLIVPLSKIESFDDLQSAGFSGVDLTLQGGDHDYVVTTAIDTHTTAPTTLPGSQQIHILYRETRPAILTDITNQLESLNFTITASPIEDGSVATNVMMLGDFEAPLLRTVTENEFLGLQKTLTSAKTLLWLTGGGLFAGKNPEFAVSVGFLRAISSEQASMSVVTMDFDTETTSAAEIVNLSTEKVVQLTQAQSIEKEYQISNGKLYISRLLPEKILNSIHCVTDKDVYQMNFDPAQPIVGRLRPGKILFDRDDRIYDDLNPEFVEVKVSVTGLSRDDIMIASATDFSTIFNHEVGGIITRVGSAIKDFEIGDQVIGFSFDQFATFQRLHSNLIQKVNHGESLSQLVSLPKCYAEALHGLKSLANLQPGEKVLILPGCGLVGSAAINVVNALGGQPHVIVDNFCEVEVVRKQFGLDEASVTLRSKMSQLKGSDGLYDFSIIFSASSVHENISKEAWRFISHFGRFVECGRKTTIALARTVVERVPLNRGASFLAFDITDMHIWKPTILGQLLGSTLELYRLGLVSAPAPLVLRNISELNSCISSFTDEFGAGKTVIVHEKSDKPLEALPVSSQLRFRPDGTYLLVGCLGGLGRSLTSWMLAKGARNFAFLSRSGADSNQATILVNKLVAAGATVDVFRGDVCVREDVEHAIRCVPSSRPIRGVIQAAMVLRDMLFTNMSHEDWKTSINPKVNGTINIHEALQHNLLDFFVTTSSVSGIFGQPSQCNYAAGNSFMDSFARHRRVRNLKAASIALPMILGIGVVAESGDIEKLLARKGYYGIYEAELIKSFEVAIMEQQKERPLDHLIVGLDPGLIGKAIQEAADRLDLFWSSDPRFSGLLHMVNSRIQDSGATTHRSLLANIQDADIASAEVIRIVIESLITKLSQMLMIDREEFTEEGRSIGSYGLDSMIGAELRNWIFKEMGLDISFQKLLSPSLTIKNFAEMVCENQGIKLE